MLSLWSKSKSFFTIYYAYWLVFLFTLVAFEFHFTFLPSPDLDSLLHREARVISWKHNYSMSYTSSHFIFLITSNSAHNSPNISCLTLVKSRTLSMVNETQHGLPSPLPLPHYAFLPHSLLCTLCSRHTCPFAIPRLHQACPHLKACALSVLFTWNYCSTVMCRDLCLNSLSQWVHPRLFST